MQVGDEAGHGRYGMLDEDAVGLLCHECGLRFAHLGLHAYKAHGLTADEYRAAHGLSRRGLVVEATGRALADNARDRYPSNTLFVQRRNPAGATAARLEVGKGLHSPAGLEAMRQASTGKGARQRLGTVVACELCGVEFCPLLNAKRRRFCSYSCASRHTRALERLGPGGVVSRTALGDGDVTLSVRLRPRPSWFGGAGGRAPGRSRRAASLDEFLAQLVDLPVVGGPQVLHALVPVGAFALDVGVGGVAFGDGGGKGAA